MDAAEMIDLHGQPSLLRAPLNGYRIATESYGPMAPLPPGTLLPRGRRVLERFGAPGRTIYVARTRRGAFTECLYDRRLDHQSRSAIAFMAEAFGESWEEAFARYAAEQLSLGHPAPGTLPATWRESRKAYELRSAGDLTWFDLAADHSLAYLDRVLGAEIYRTCNVASIDASHLIGDNRALTTLVATRLRSLRLRDGGHADGIRFASRHGIGQCWAFWMRRTARGVDHEPVSSGNGSSFSVRDLDFNAVAKRFDIRIQ
jgi:hypothetical protein